MTVKIWLVSDQQDQRMAAMKKFAAFSGVLMQAAAMAAEPAALPPELQPLNLIVGTWRFQGETLAVGDQKAEKWTWTEECSWTANRAFITCSYVMNYPGKVVKSQVIDTYNRQDQAYWHYEMFDSDGNGAEPFISKMTISGNRWTNFGTADQKTYRVTYEFVTPAHISLRVESTSDNVTWTLLEQGEGYKNS